MKSFSPKEGSVSSILKGVVSGPDSMLEKLLAAGEFQQASQLMTTVITVLNEDSTKAHDSESPDTKDRVEVGEYMVLYLTIMLKIEIIRIKPMNKRENNST